MTTRPRLLPLTPPPVHRETLGSYLNRLADANHLTIGYLSSLVGPSRQHRRVDNRVGYWTPDALGRLVALTGRSPSCLIHAMPPLGTIGDPLRPLRSATEEVIEPRRRPACRLCMAGGTSTASSSAALPTMKASATVTTAGSSAMNSMT